MRRGSHARRHSSSCQNLYPSVFVDMVPLELGTVIVTAAVCLPDDLGGELS